MKLFELEIPVLKASKELQLSYNTTHKIYTIIREKIYNYCSKDDILKVEIDNKIPVFGILLRETIKKVKRGSIICLLYTSDAADE